MSKASTDKAIKASFKSQPGATLNEICTAVPDDVKIAVIEDSPNAVTFVLPAAKSEGQLQLHSQFTHARAANLKA